MTVTLEKVANGWIVNTDLKEEFTSFPSNTYLFKTSKEMYEWMHEHIGD